MYRDLRLVLTGAAIGLTAAIGINGFTEQPRFTLDTGYSDCRFTPSPDGQWYQKDQDHSSRYKAGCGTIGISFKATEDWTFGVHYVQLGRTNVEALAIAFPGDARENMNASIDPMRAPCRDSFKDGCLYQWHTGSFTRGVNFSTSFKLFQIDEVRFEGKVGAYAHQLSSHAVVEPLGCRDNCPWRVQVNQTAQRITPMWGAIVRWKWLYFGWEFYEQIGDHTPVIANVKGRVEVKTIGVSIPI